MISIHEWSFYSGQSGIYVLLKVDGSLAPGALTDSRQETAYTINSIIRSKKALTDQSYHFTVN